MRSMSTFFTTNHTLYFHISSHSSTNDDQSAGSINRTRTMLVPVSDDNTDENPNQASVTIVITIVSPFHIRHSYHTIDIPIVS
jgi:hypothetical protein